MKRGEVFQVGTSAMLSSDDGLSVAILQKKNMNCWPRHRYMCLVTSLRSVLPSAFVARLVRAVLCIM